jgi:hypothetical protein
MQLPSGLLRSIMSRQAGSMPISLLLTLRCCMVLGVRLQVCTVQLHNPREVPAEWSIKRPAVDSPKLRDWGLFVPEPAEGCLEPGASVNVKVTFTPTLGRELPYSLALPIKVANNPKVRELQCTGKGYTPRVDFSSKVLDCGAILPRFPGQQPAEATLQLRNLGDRPLEVVCLDLDKQYQADEEALRSLDMWVLLCSVCLQRSTCSCALTSLYALPDTAVPCTSLAVASPSTACAFHARW